MECGCSGTEIAYGGARAKLQAELEKPAPSASAINLRLLAKDIQYQPTNISIGYAISAYTN
eukprot:1004081-Rhodomonas_salina.2